MAQSILRLNRLSSALFKRSIYTVNKEAKDAVILGIYERENKEEFELTEDAEKYCAYVGNDLIEKISSSGPIVKAGTSRVLSNNIAVVGLGKKPSDFSNVDPSEERIEARESVRTGVAAGIRALKGLNVGHIKVDPCGDPESAAEGALLPQWTYDELKAEDKRKKPVDVSPIGDECSQWVRGIKKAQGQNVARTLMETPANFMTPTLFAQNAERIFKNTGVNVQVYDQAWAESMKMGSFLSVSAGSDQPPAFLELTYNGAARDESPLALVGKGVTFDTGGISLKPSKGMDAMRADMGGAACVVGTLSGIAALSLPINVKAFIPLCENMPNGRATKPGDVVRAMNGKSIQVDNTDAEGRLILADALCYAHQFNPKLVLDIATLTGAMAGALGGAATGVFTNSNSMWPVLHKAGGLTGDRVWRMPLWNYYSKQIAESRLADLNNIGSKPYGGACTAAAFLKEFVTCDNWFHLDIAGVMDNSGEVPYLSNGMAGRPTRTLIQFFDDVD